MSIYAEDIEKAIGFLPGLFKLNSDGLFTQAVLTLTKDSLMIYDDNAPDTTDGADWSYKVKVCIPLDTIVMVTNVDVIAKRRLAENTNKLLIQVKDKDTPITFFYYEAKESLALNFLMGLKRYKVKTKSTKSKLAY